LNLMDRDRDYLIKCHKFILGGVNLSVGKSKTEVKNAKVAAIDRNNFCSKNRQK